ncbi:MAG: dihydrodipicolinate synthase family protein [Planctomycetaceae bacterium]|nr:MAG: dihydrodipicolinate synthase family protein [Planctomycetaceae bacterium]
MLDSLIVNQLRSGCVIPAHPLALQSDNRIDERHQRALTRYYLAAGAGGLALGVHTMQFAIHEPKVGLYRPVLELAIETARQFTAPAARREPIMIAGIVGDTEQAMQEARLARQFGYHLGLLSLTALKGKSIDELIDHSRRVAGVIPIMGFYLQQTISKMTLPAEFWQKFVTIPNVLAVKIAPFNRYQSLDVLEAVARSGRADEIALYTGNDDNIILDLLTRHEFNIAGRPVSLRIVGGLLGQWACWTKKAVEHLARIKAIRENNTSVPQDLLTLAAQLTLANKAIFDAENQFRGCISGISYVLKRQGLLKEINTLDPGEQLSDGQAERIDRIIRDYPHLTDDDFVKENLNQWFSS